MSVHERVTLDEVAVDTLRANNEDGAVGDERFPTADISALKICTGKKI